MTTDYLEQRLILEKMLHYATENPQGIFAELLHDMSPNTAQRLGNFLGFTELVVPTKWRSE